jgi:hypothetical protein
MTNMAEKRPHSIPQSEDAETSVRMLRAVIQAIPEERRAEVLERVRDLIPSSLFKNSRIPQRGGDVLNNVFELFKSEPAVERGAPEVHDALAKSGKPAEPQSIRNALNYMSSRQILQRVGYGRYRMADGSMMEGPV